jgi:hypothetical protein
MNVSEWQTRLERTFSGERVVPIVEAERECARRFVEKFIGHRVITDSFLDFYVETLELANEWQGGRQPPGPYGNYLYTMLVYVVNFRTLRAAENLSLCGYPLDAFALLRDLKDRALFLGAIAAGRTSVAALWMRPNTVQAHKAMERRLLDQMVGKESGLDDQVQKEIKQWAELFHLEVHGSQLTRTRAFGELQDQRRLSIGPTFDDLSSAMYMNRCCEVLWMLLRTLPFLQCESHAFGDEWANKWRVLDDSFRYDVESLGEMGKPIAYAIIALLDAKFSFSPDSSYDEPR